MDEQLLELYWSELPVGKGNAADYPRLCEMWGRHERTVRLILHELSSYDNRDDYVLIRSSKSKGFYKTDDIEEIKAYRKECLNKGRSIFAPIRKCNRILNADDRQAEMFNNMRYFRTLYKLTQKEVCDYMKKFDKNFDESLLSKMENGVCCPTFYQLAKLAEFYGVNPHDIIAVTDLPVAQRYAAF